MSLYPSLEDMKVDQVVQAQAQVQQDHALAVQLQQSEMAGGQQMPGVVSAPTAGSSANVSGGLYPSLSDYMGLNLNSSEVQGQMAVVPVPQYQAPAINTGQPSQIPGMVAPVSHQGVVGMARAEVKQGVRQVVLCKNANGKMGLRVKSISKGIFVAHVTKDSPAALGGLRFGDQILLLNNEVVAGYSTEKAMKMLKNANPQRIELAIRDRPFERTVTLQKDSANHVGFMFKDGKIGSIVKDTSAARNGLLIDHQLCEVNGQCVIGMKDKDVLELMLNGGLTVTVTIMPCFVYDHIIKSLGSSLLKNQDHSIPDV